MTFSDLLKTLVVSILQIHQFVLDKLYWSTWYFFSSKLHEDEELPSLGILQKLKRLWLKISGVAVRDMCD